MRGAWHGVPEWLLLLIGHRDSWTCHVCKQGYDPTQTWEIDHDIPRAKGGTNHVRNLRLSHGGCNRDKAAA